MDAAARVFVSYQSADDAIAQRLVEILEGAGHQCWHMTASIGSGDDWASEIVRGIAWCSDFVLLFGRHTNESEHVADEVTRALASHKRVHPLRISAAPPRGVFDLRLGRLNWVDWRDLSTPPVKLLETLAKRPAPQSTRMPVVDEPVETGSLFVDRLPERDALRLSLEQHLRGTADEAAASAVQNNVLTYFGAGGQGKSYLSRRLESWIGGRLPTDDHWGSPPRTALTLRWNLDEDVPRPQPISFLLDLRRTLAATGLRFDSFDVAVAALYAVTLGRLDDPSTAVHAHELLEPIRQLSWEAGLTPLPESINLDILRRLVQAGRDSTLFTDAEALEDALTLIRANATEQDAAPRMLASVLTLAAGVLAAQPASRRPTIAIFLDTFEKVQSPQGRATERLLNALVVNLPLCLFVVTGREQLTWHEPESAHLDWFGPDRWPSLVRCRPEDAEPRQHALDCLSLDDTKVVLAHTLSEVGWQATDAELNDLAIETRGWPLHVQIVSNLIRERHQHGREMLQYADLRGSFPALVQRLLEHLPDDVQLALQASAVVPSFDRTMLRSCDPAIRAGSVTRLLRTSLVSRSSDPYFPYKLHDELRRAIRAAGGHVDGGWEDEDRLEAAERVVLGLERRWRKAREAGEHAEMMHVHAVAVTICLEYGLSTEWVKEMFVVAPSHTYQRDLLPDVEHHQGSDGELPGLVRVYRTLGLEDGSQRLAELREISDMATSDRVRFRADLWTMYTLRALSDYPAARTLSERMVDDPYDRNCGEWKKPVKLVRRQHANTLATGLWWGDLQAFDPAHTHAEAWASVQDAHGRFDESVAAAFRKLQEQIAARKSYRFQMNVQSTYVWRQLRAGGGAPLPWLEELVDYCRRYAPAWLRGVLISRVGPWAVQRGLADPDKLWNLLCEIRTERGTSSCLTLARYGTGVARLTGEMQYAQAIWEEFIDPSNRTLENLSFDFLFDALGMPIPPALVEWREDVAIVRQRWLDGWDRSLTPPEGWEYSPERYGW